MTIPRLVLTDPGGTCDAGAMAKQRSTKQRMRALENRLVSLEREHADLAKRVKKLSKRVEALPDPAGFGARGFERSGVPFPGPGGPGGPGVPGGPNFFWRRPGGGPPRRRHFGPVVSLEVPLETDDPTAPLWATVAARLPEEITTVSDDGAVVRYRYSAVGSTPQAPRYRRLTDQEQPFPATAPPSPE
jgi:hypothetical protein